MGGGRRGGGQRKGCVGQDSRRMGTRKVWGPMSKCCRGGGGGRRPVGACRQQQERGDEVCYLESGSGHLGGDARTRPP